MTYGELLNWAKKLFSDSERKSDVERLLMHHSGLEHANLLAHLDDEASEVCAEAFKESVTRLLADEPLQYILGYAYFDGLIFKVNESVLIPRFDTEVLLDFAKNALTGGKTSILDLCTGSGILAISLAKAGGEVFASDISPEALAIAQENANAHNVSVTFKKGDLFEPWKDMTFDMIVSNPPYIDDVGMTMLDKRVLKEPHLALYGGSDGLNFYKKIISTAKDYLNDTGLLALEIGYNQGHLVSGLFEEYGFQNIVVLNDTQGHSRVVLGMKW